MPVVQCYRRCYEHVKIYIVRWIFDSYLAGMNTYDFAEALTATGCHTSEGTPYWGKNAINYILQNEKYIGDSLGQKSFTADTFPFREMNNNGQRPQYYAAGTHLAIIDKDTFERCRRSCALDARKMQGCAVSIHFRGRYVERSSASVVPLDMHICSP